MTETIQEWELTEEEREKRDRKIEERIAEELSVRPAQVRKTIELIDEGNTIPFIARYRKELTGSLDDGQLRILDERLNSLRNLEETKEDVIRKIGKQGKLTQELADEILQADTVKAVDDLYLPYKQKRQTRASKARDRGLEPLSEAMKAGQISSQESFDFEPFLSEEVPDSDAALQGARDIIAEEISETASIRDILRKNLWNSGHIVSKKQKDVDEEEAEIYEMYFDFLESIDTIPAHRILAMNRAEKEGFVKITLETTDDRNIFRIQRELTRGRDLDRDSFCFSQIREAVEDSYKRLLFPSIETEIRSELTEGADAESIEIFGDNLRPYLMQPPLKETVIMGLDPGFRTGCKLAVINENGSFLDSATIYPTAPKNDVSGSIATMEEMIQKYDVDLIAIGNGTASRETEQVVSQLIRSYDEKELYYAIVNESGASVYSASQLAEDEFPNLDVTIRGAISIARRIQDPLAELVKIEPKHIGVGQYQHDVNQKDLDKALDGVVESCVNAVGVDVNTASPSLLSYVAGVSNTVAKNILAHKEENGIYTSRKDLKEVKGLGPKTYEQCAGFIRVPESEEVLDNTGVHPESYEIARKLEGLDLDQINIKKKAEELEVGLPTLQDIIEELRKPGRDPREEMPKPVLRSDVLSMDDLEEGMELRGTVRNVVAFGCFVDIGVGQDGLVHISELGEAYYEDVSQIVQVSDIVNVKIISLDKKRERIGLSMKGMKQSDEIERLRQINAAKGQKK